jgi:hypothetical protein
MDTADSSSAAIPSGNDIKDRDRNEKIEKDDLKGIVPPCLKFCRATRFGTRVKQAQFQPFHPVVSKVRAVRYTSSSASTCCLHLATKPTRRRSFDYFFNTEW